jgi:hypothetical protein
MSIQSVYRVGIWLPLAVPALVAGLVHGLGVAVDVEPLRKIVQILLMSLLYGGVPYAFLAMWATWWVGGRSEPEIKRVMMRAPLLMVAVFVPVVVLAGLAVGHAVPFIALAVLGAIVTIPLGYMYVGLVMLLRQFLGPRVAADAAP